MISSRSAMGSTFQVRRGTSGPYWAQIHAKGQKKRDSDRCNCGEEELVRKEKNSHAMKKRGINRARAVPVKKCKSPKKGQRGVRKMGGTNVSQ